MIALPPALSRHPLDAPADGDSWRTRSGLVVHVGARRPGDSVLVDVGVPPALVRTRWAVSHLAEVCAAGVLVASKDGAVWDGLVDGARGVA